MFDVAADHLFTYGWLGFILAIWTALSIGSFLNVVIYRLPVMMNRQWDNEARAFLEQPPNPESSEPFNLMVPRSHCPGCRKMIRAWQNIPLFSWLGLRGRCANCNTPISIRYPFIELFTCLATLLVIGLFGFTGLGLAAATFTWVLIALTFIDYDTQLLPDQLTLPLLWLGLLINYSGGFVDLGSAVIGAIAGYGFLWLTYWGFKLVTGKEGMGYGDFKLFGAIGAWLGWQILPSAILIASLVGLLYALVTMLAGKRSAAQPIAFGPFLAVAGWVSMLGRDTVIALFTL